MRTIELTQGQVAKVSDHNFEYINQWNWYALWDDEAQAFYAVRKEGKNPFRKLISMHRVVAKTPDGMLCDHRNHDTLDNQDDNLRNVTASQNMINRRVSSNNKLGEKCISPWRGGFRVKVNKDKKLVFCKTFRTIEEAIIARNEAVIQIHGEFAYLN